MSVTAFILLDVNPGKDEEVVEDVRKIPRVREAHRVFGVYDIIIEAEVKDKEGLRNLVSKNIATISGVRSSLTMIVKE